MTESDSPALRELLQGSHDTGEIGMAPRFNIDPYVGFTEMLPDRTKAGFLAESKDGTPAGVGFVMLTEARVGGDVRPAAFLNSLVVAPNYRGRGLAKRLAARRIEYARTEQGEDCVVYATIQQGNEPSRAVADTWADDFMYETARVQLPPLEEEPDAEPYTVRPVADGEYPTVVERLNEFYADAELYSPFTVDQFRTRVAASPIDEPVQRYLVAVHDGDIVAGLGVSDAHKLMWQEVVEVPEQFAEAGELPPSIPESREIRPTSVGLVWHESGHADAVDVLLDAVRADPDAGNRITLALDPDGPLGQFVTIDEGAVELDVAIRGEGTSGEAGFVAPTM